MALRRLAIAAAFIGLFAWSAPPAEANILHGIGSLIGGILQIPIQTLMGTFSGPPILGTLMGAVNGTIQGTGMVLGGALELLGDGFSLAKTAAPYVLPFVF